MNAVFININKDEIRDLMLSTHSTNITNKPLLFLYFFSNQHEFIMMLLIDGKLID